MSHTSPHASQNLASIQALRGIAGIFIVTIHFSTIQKSYLHGFPLLVKWTDFARYGVDLFFVISGFIIVYSTCSHWGNPGQWWKFMLRRLLRVYPVYWQISLIALLVYWLNPALIDTSYLEQQGKFLSFLLVPQTHPPFLSVGWTLIYELYFYLIFSLMFLIKNLRFTTFIFGWSYVVAVLNLGVLPLLTVGAHPVLRVLGDPLAFEFICGGVAAWIYKKHKINLQPLWLPLSAMLVLAASVTLMITGKPSHWLRVVLLAPSMGLLIYTIMDIEAVFQRKPWALLSRIGDASYSFYLSHLIVFSMLWALWRNLHINNVWLNLPYMLLAIATAIGIAMLNYHWFEKPVMAWTKRLIRRMAGR